MPKASLTREHKGRTLAQINSENSESTHERMLKDPKGVGGMSQTI